MLVLFIISLLNCYVTSLNILVAKVSATKSHNNLFGGIIDSLLEHNHTVSTEYFKIEIITNIILLACIMNSQFDI